LYTIGYPELTEEVDDHHVLIISGYRGLDLVEIYLSLVCLAIERKE